jgi:hypothetical protein
MGIFVHTNRVMDLFILQDTRHTGDQHRRLFSKQQLFQQSEKFFGRQLHSFFCEIHLAFQARQEVEDRIESNGKLPAFRQRK